MFHADGCGRFRVFFARFKLRVQFRWNARLAKRSDSPNLREINDRQKTGNNGNVNACPMALISEPEEICVFIKQLRDNGIGTCIDLAFQVG